MAQKFNIIASYSRGSDFYYKGKAEDEKGHLENRWVGCLRADEALDLTWEEANAILPELAESLPSRNVTIVRA